MSDPPRPPSEGGGLEWWISAIAPAAWLLLVAALGRLHQHHRQARLGHRRLLSWSLLWEVPTAALCAVLGAGAADGLGVSLDSPAAAALVGVVSLLGPRGVEASVASALEAHGLRVHAALRRPETPPGPDTTTEPPP